MTVTYLTVHPPEYQCATSDHYLITFTTNFKHLVSTPTTKEVFNYSKGDYNGLSEYLLGRDLSVLFSSSDVEEIWHLLRSYIISGMDLFIPIQDYVSGNSPSGLHHNCAIQSSVFVHYSENLIKTHHLTTTSD